MGITKSTIVRTMMILLVIVNFGLEKFGVDIIPVDESTVFTIVETILEIAAIAVVFWKNNSFSEKAIKADKFLKELRESE